MKSRTAEIKEKLFFSIVYINKWKVQSEFLIGLFFFIHLICQLSFLDYVRLNGNTQISQSYLFPFLKKVSSYIYFTRDQNYRAMDENLYISVGLIFTVILVHLIIIWIASKKERTDWQGYLMMVINFLLITFTFPLFQLELTFIQKGIQKQLYYLLPPGIIAIILSLGFEYFYNELCFTIRLQNLNNFDRTYYFFESKKILLLKVIFLYFSLRKEIYGRIQILIGVILLLIISLLDFIFKIRQIVYFKKTVSEMSFIQNIILICFYFLTLVQVNVILLRQNLAPTLLSSAIGFIWSQRVVEEYKKTELSQKSISQISSKSDAINYIRSLYENIINFQDTFSSTLLAGLIYEHKTNCKDISCFCNSSNYDAPLYKNPLFLRDFSRYLIDKIEEKFSTSTEVNLHIINYKIQIYRQFTKYFKKLKIYSEKEYQKFQELSPQFMIYEIKILVEDVVQDLSKGKSCEINTVFQQESLEKEIKQSLQKMLEGLVGVYKFLKRVVCNLNSLDSLLLNVYKRLKFMFEKWQRLKKNESKNMQIYCVFYFFCNNILDLNFEKKFIVQRLTTISKKLQTASTKKNFNINYMLFSKDGATVQSLTEAGKIGIIHRVSGNIESIFGIHDEKKILNTPIENILPYSLRQEHNRMIKNWVQNFNNTFFNQIVDVYCVNFYEKLFQAKLFMQMILVENQLRIQVSFVKINEKDYLCVSDEGIIENFGQSFEQIFTQKIKGKKLIEICNNATDLWKTATNSRKKRVLNINMSKIYEEELFIGSQKKVRNMKYSKLSGQFSMEVQYFFFTIRTKKVLILKYLQFFQKVTERVRKQKLFDYYPSIMLDSEKNIEDNIFSESQDKKTEQIKYIELQSRSSMRDDSTYSLEKLLRSIIKNVIAGQRLDCQKTKTKKIVLILIFIVLIVLIGFQLFFYSRGIFSYNEVIFADGAVSDNMQLLQFSYNKITKIYQYCGKDLDEVRCEFVKDSAKNIQNYLYGLMAQDIKYILKNVTFFNNPYYEYEFYPLNVTIGNTTVEMETTQFMEYFIYSSKKIIDIVERQGLPNAQSDFIYKVLQTNWPHMKHINHFNLEWYELMGKQELQIVQLSMILMLILIVLIFTCYLLIIYKDHKLLEEKRKKIMFLYRLIPISAIDSLKSYYQQIRNDLNKQVISELIEKQYPTFNFQKSYSKLEIKFSYSIKIKLILGSLWIILLSLHIYIFISMIDLFPKCQNMISNINSLMDSENYLLQNYFQLKVYYLQGSSMNYDEFQSQLLQSLQQDQVTFNTIALKAMTTFQEDDPKFLSEFSDLLIDNICDLTKNFFVDWEVEKCYNEMHHKMLEEGLMPSMTQFQRIVYQAVFDLKKSTTNPSQYFKKQIFQDLDDYIIYMFKLYQATKKRMNDGLVEALNSRIIFLASFAASEVFILTFILVVWLIRLKAKNLALAQLFGYISFYPKAMLRQNKAVIKTINETLFD